MTLRGMAARYPPFMHELETVLAKHRPDLLSEFYRVAAPHEHPRTVGLFLRHHFPGEAWGVSPMTQAPQMLVDLLRMHKEKGECG